MDAAATGARPRAGRRRRAAIALLLGFVAGALLAPPPARPHGDTGMVVGSTADAAGALAIAFDFAATKIVVTQSAAIGGFRVYTASDPAFEPLAVDEPATPLFALDDGTEVRVELVAPLDTGVSLKVNGVVLDSVGETTIVGTYHASNPAAFHTHPTWTLTLPAGVHGEHRVSFVLTAVGGGYAASPVYTAVLTNPDATSTPAPSATPSATPLVATPHVSPSVPIPPHLADPLATRDAIACTAAIAKAGRALAAARTRALGACIGRVAACVQTRAGDAGCLARAGVGCARTFARLGRTTPAVERAVVAACGALAVEALLGEAGIGLQAAATECAAFAVDLADAGSVARCLARQHACEVERRFTIGAPRTVALLALAGIVPDADSCLVDRGGGGQGSPAGKALLGCDVAVRRAAATLARVRVSGLQRCGAALFGCAQEQPGDAACRARAAAACARVEARTRRAADDLGLKAAARCGGVPFAALADATGLHLAALAADCAALGVAGLATLDDYLECVRRADACAAEALLRLQMPRAGELRDAIGEPPGASCGP